MTKQSFKNGLSLKESRLTFWFKEVGPNMKNWAGDAFRTYVGQGIEERNIVKIIAGVPMLIASVLAEASDYGFAGIADEPMEATNSRIGRDVDKIKQNHVRHPIRTVLSGTRLITSVPMDIGDDIFGFTHGTPSKTLAI